MNNNSYAPKVTCDNIIVIDADYADRVAFDLIVNFERIIGRHIDNADTARWIDCIALDGGLREGDNQTQVVFVHSHGKLCMENFNPGKLQDELHGKAFKDNLGEFTINACSEETIISKTELFADIIRLAVVADEVKRIIAIPDEEYYSRVARVLRDANPDKHITMMAMQPMPGGNFRQEILGYSLMNAMGIKADEIPSE